MKKAMTIFAVLSMVMITGCATRPGAITALAVNSSDYAGLSCDQAKRSLSEVSQKEKALTDRQNMTASFDEVGVFLFALPLGSLFGGDRQGDLARAKGESIALERYVYAKCPG